MISPAFYWPVTYFQLSGFCAFRIRKHSQVKADDDTILSVQQIKALQKRNGELEEENLILKKADAIFTPHLMVRKCLYEQK